MERRAPLLAALGAALAGAALVYAASAALNPYLLSIVAFGGINIILAVSLNITNGFTGLFSLGHATRLSCMLRVKIGKQNWLRSIDKNTQFEMCTRYPAS